MWTEEELAGKTIIGVRVCVKSTTVWLEVQGGGWIEIGISGDCCSSAFVDAVRLHGTPKLTGEITEISFSAEPTEQYVDKITAVQFHGEKGQVSILHRNSSNGYYGNWMQVTSRGEPAEDAVAVKSDWYRVTAE